MNIVRNIAACAAALLTVCGCVSPGGGRACWERAGDALLPELGGMAEAPELLRAAIERRRSGRREARDA